MIQLTSFQPWARIAYGRTRFSHAWRVSERDSHFARSNCVLEVLIEQLDSADGLQKCKHCEKEENREGKRRG